MCRHARLYSCAQSSVGFFRKTRDAGLVGAQHSHLGAVTFTNEEEGNVQVLIARWNGARVACKVAREDLHASSAVLADLRQDAEVLQDMRHPYILTFYGACFDCRPVRDSRRLT